MFSPRRQFSVDQRHPLARDLAFALPLNFSRSISTVQPAPRDLASGLQPISYQGSFNQQRGVPGAGVRNTLTGATNTSFAYAPGGSLSYSGVAGRKSLQKIGGRHPFTLAALVTNYPSRCGSPSAIASVAWNNPSVQYTYAYLSFYIATSKWGSWRYSASGQVGLVGNTVYATEGGYYSVVQTYDGSKQRLYVNGMLDAEANDTNDLAQTANLVVINTYWASNFAHAASYGGTIHDVRLWARCLQPQEISQLWANPWGMYCSFSVNSIATPEQDIDTYTAGQRITSYSYPSADKGVGGRSRPR